MMHLAHVKMQFQAAELSDIPAVWANSATTNATYHPTARMIVVCCQGLAKLDGQAGQLRLARYAIQEYLVSNWESLVPQFELKRLCVL